MKYAMIKIRDPRCVPVSMVCQYDNQEVQMPPQQVHVPEKINPILKSKCVFHPAQSQIQKTELEVFKLEWKFKNVGDSVWPQDVKFIQVNGDNLVYEVEF